MRATELPVASAESMDGLMAAWTRGFSAAHPLGPVPADSELQQRDQLRSYEAREAAELNRLAWTDGTKTLAKVPIDDALRLLAAKGAAR